MKIKELRELTKEDLVQKEKAFKKALFGLNYQRQFGRVEKPGQFKLLHRDIARIKTLQKEREKDGAKK